MNDKQQPAPERIFINWPRNPADDAWYSLHNEYGNAIEYIRADLLQRVADEKRLAEIRERLKRDQSAQPTRDEVDFLLSLQIRAWQPDPHTWEAQPQKEILCACRTFDVGPARAYLDGCEFLHTTVYCPPERFVLQPPPAASERCGECGHNNVNRNNGFCVEWVDRKQRRCGHKCVFPATGATSEHEEAKDDGWVTFGRVKVDIENETETFERIHPPAAAPPVEPCAVCKFHWNQIVMPGETHNRNCPHNHDAEKGCACQQCGKRFTVDINVQDGLWAKISNGKNLLCGSCITKAIESLSGFDSYYLSREIPSANTPGDAAREAHSEFEQWKQKYAPNDSGKDYDFRGAFDAGVLPDANGHWPDLFKRPNHPTFSEESVFAIGLNASEAGRWHNSLFFPPTAPAPFSAFASGERLGNREGQMTTEQYDAFRAGMLRAAEMARNEFKRAPEAAKGEDCVWMGGYESACDHLSIVIAQAAVIDSVPIGERRPDWKYHISLLLPEETPDETVKGIYCVVEQLLREVAPAPARHYFCSCGGALTAEEYLEHYFEKGHDRGIGGKTAPAGVEAVARQAALRIQTWLREEGEFGRDVIQELTDIIVAEFTHCATPAPAESGEDLDDMEFTLNWNRLQGGNYRALHERWQPIFDLVKQLRDQVRQGTPAPRG